MVVATINEARLSRPTFRLRAAVKQNHLDAIGRANTLAARFASQAAPVKAELRRLAVAKEPDAVRQAQQLFHALAAKYAAQVAADVRRQAEVAFRQVRMAMNAVLPANLVGVNPPPARLPVALADVVVPPIDKRKDALELAALLGLFLVGMSMARVGNRAGLLSAETAVDKLANRARLSVRGQGIWASNRATRVAVETGLVNPPIVPATVPMARRVIVPPMARRHEPPAEKLPVPLIRTPPVEPGPGKMPVPTIRTPQIEPGPGKMPIPAVPRGPTPPSVVPIPPTVRRGPAPGEPEFVILPEPKPAPPVVPGKIPPRDPDPLSPIPTASNLIGWQVLSVLIPTTRPKHRHRHKDIFYYFPRDERGEKGMELCPNPPHESTAEGGVLAWGCLCSIVPVFGGTE